MDQGQKNWLKENWFKIALLLIVVLGIVGFLIEYATFEIHKRFNSTESTKSLISEIRTPTIDDVDNLKNKKYLDKCLNEAQVVWETGQVANNNTNLFICPQMRHSDALGGGLVFTAEECHNRLIERSNQLDQERRDSRDYCFRRYPAN